MTGDAWVPVGLSEGLPPGAVRATRVAGEDVALWRQRSGPVHAWPNRCPHRGMRLSFGCVRDDRLACAYHGFRFDGAGACAHVPAQPDFVPAGMAVAPHACAERDGFVWAALAPGPGDGPPGGGEATEAVCTLGVDADAAEARERLAGLAFPPLRLRSAGPLGLERLGGDRARWSGRDGTSVEVRYEAAWLAPGLLRVAAVGDAGGERLVVAVQALGAGACALHFRAGADGAERPAIQHHHHRLAERLRRALERADADPAAWSPLP